MKGAIDRRALLGDELEAGLGVRRIRDVEERGVALELRELQVRLRRVDHRLEQLRDDVLRVREARLMEFHEARVAGDVGDQQESRLDGQAIGWSRRPCHAHDVAPADARIACFSHAAARRS